MARVLYFCPDFPQPSGGVKTLYRHVCRLCASGFDAAIVHQRSGFRTTWHAYDAPILWLEDRPEIDRNDILVFPEVMVDLVRQTRNFGGERVVIALSWAPAYNRLQPGERWQELGIHHVLAKSPTIKRYLEWSMDAEVTLVPEFVDPALYRMDLGQKVDKIAFATRKDRGAALLSATLARRGSPFDDYEWQPLRELDESDYARQLRQSRVYLTTTVQEGMHVSLLEAMACGALVVGFSGIGGNDYLIPNGEERNAILVENGNLPALGVKLESILRTLSESPDHFADVIENAQQTARSYQDADAESKALTAFFRSLTERA